MEIFDSHAHYDDEKFNEDREEIIKSIYEEGITKCINIGCDIKTSENSIKLSEKYDFIYATCSIHPSEIPQTEQELWKQLVKIKEMAKINKKVVGIGEIGLDYHWNKDNIELQKKAFIEQIKLANELDLPIVIHAFNGVRVCVCVLILNAIIKLGKKSIVDKLTFAIFIAVSILSIVTSLSPIIYIIISGVIGALIYKFRGGKEEC